MEIGGGAWPVRVENQCDPCERTNERCCCRGGAHFAGAKSADRPPFDRIGAREAALIQVLHRSLAIRLSEPGPCRRASAIREKRPPPPPPPLVGRRFFRETRDRDFARDLFLTRLNADDAILNYFRVSVSRRLILRDSPRVAPLHIEDNENYRGLSRQLERERDRGGGGGREFV